MASSVRHLQFYICLTAPKVPKRLKITFEFPMQVAFVQCHEFDRSFAIIHHRNSSQKNFGTPGQSEDPLRATTGPLLQKMPALMVSRRVLGSGWLEGTT